MPPGLEKKDDLPPGRGGVNPGQGRERRSERAQERAQDVYKNPTLTGEKPRRGRPSSGAAAPAEVQGQRAFTGELPGEFLYFYHPDHLGSTSYVTDDKGAIYEHLQYFPFGETWVQEGQPSNRIPYLFTSKELDAETNLYYFGARYYDPRTSVWVSADPLFEQMLPVFPENRGNEDNGEGFAPELDLPSGGGVYNSFNLNLFAYVRYNPLTFTDPDGQELVRIVAAGAERKPQRSSPNAIFFVEKRFASKFRTLIAVARIFGLSVNNTFRAVPSSQVDTDQPKADKVSRHQCGCAIDINGIKSLSPAARKVFFAFAKSLGFKIGAEADKPDLNHFSQDPASIEKTLNELITENKKDFIKIFSALSAEERSRAFGTEIEKSPSGQRFADDFSFLDQPKEKPQGDGFAVLF